MTALLLAVLAAIPTPAGPARADEPAEVGLEAAENEALGQHVARQYRADLDEILARRYLRVLTSNNSFDYFIYQGRHAGYQYEMVKAFTQYLNKKYNPGRRALKIQFELLPVRSEQLIPMLLAGQADMIAARLTITPQREEQVLFSRPYRETRELLVGPEDLDGIETIEDLSGRRVAVRRSSSYFESLVRQNQRLLGNGLSPIEVELVDEGLETESLLELVSAGRFELTVADSIVARTATEVIPNLKVFDHIALRRKGELAWATHKGSDALKAEMDAFLRRYRQGSLLGNIAVKKYFKNLGSLRTRLNDLGESALSAYDDLFRRVAAKYDFDWRLMAAVAYQESRFDQTSRNRSGATGLFQIKPQTAREPYVGIHQIDGPKNAANNIEAGIKYLAWIKQRYFDSISEMREKDRMRMALAAYNAGPRTLLEARRRARKMGLDANRWFRNVELALLDMNKPEPVKYVSSINQHFLSYVMLGIE